MSLQSINASMSISSLSFTSRGDDGGMGWGIACMVLVLVGRKGGVMG